jgi:ubiquinone/menaquinone biosynthesis C-methylase UbiE
MPSETAHNRHKHFLPAAGHDLFLPLYDPFVSLLGFDRARQDLIEQAMIKETHTVLDLGCGTGTLVRMLKRQFGNARVVGLDPDPKALRRAKNKAARAAIAVQLDQGFADELPYADKSFDRVLSSFMFHHLEGQDRERALKEVSRVLKPGGSFHLLDFAAADHASHGHLGRFINSHAEVKDNTQERILQLLAQAGFSKAAKIKDGRMLFGLLRTGYYQASI